MKFKNNLLFSLTLNQSSLETHGRLLSMERDRPWFSDDVNQSKLYIQIQTSISFFLQNFDD